MTLKQSSLATELFLFLSTDDTDDTVFDFAFGFELLRRTKVLVVATDTFIPCRRYALAAVRMA